MKFTRTVGSNAETGNGLHNLLQVMIESLSDLQKTLPRAMDMELCIPQLGKVGKGRRVDGPSGKWQFDFKG